MIFFKSLLFFRPNDESGSGGTLSGNKKDVYIHLKISKILHGVDMTSFNQKFAVDRGLPDKKYETAPVGASLERVKRYYSIRGKLRGVNKELAAIGVKDITDDDVREEVGFIFDEGKLDKIDFFIFYHDNC